MTGLVATTDERAKLRAAWARKAIVISMMKNAVLTPGVDFGQIPGAGKPTLFKSGAERLCAAFSFAPVFNTLPDSIQDFNPTAPLFFYRIETVLVQQPIPGTEIVGGWEIARGIGSCNSMEAKYRWRWMDEHQLRMDGLLSTGNMQAIETEVVEFDFAVRKRETSGKYGKPASYWDEWEKAIAEGRAERTQKATASGSSAAWRMVTRRYRVPNDDLFSLVNTIDKMAQKRSLIAATLIGAGASAIFTQDVEDMPGFGFDPDAPEVITVQVEPVHSAFKNEQEWREFVQQMIADHGVTVDHIRSALGIIERASEFSGTVENARDAVATYASVHDISVENAVS